MEAFGRFDAIMAEGMGAEEAMTPAEREIFKKLDTEGLVNAESKKFRLDSTMSYVSPEAKAADPAFWSKK